MKKYVKSATDKSTEPWIYLKSTNKKSSDIDKVSDEIVEKLTSVKDIIAEIDEIIHGDDGIDYDNAQYEIEFPEDCPWFDKLTDTEADMCYDAYEQYHEKLGNYYDTVTIYERIKSAADKI